MLRMTVFRKFEVCASYESSVVKSPPSPSRKPLCEIAILSSQEPGSSAMARPGGEGAFHPTPRS